VRERAFGAEHALVARSMHNVATCLRWLGRLDEAGPLLERSLAIRRAVHGPADSRVGVGLRGLGELRILQDRLDEAETALLASLAIAEKKGPEHSEVAAVEVALATLHQRRGDCPRAVAAARRALEIVLKEGPDNPDATYPLVVLGSCGSGPQALADLERAVALATAKSIDPIQVANAKLALARALWKRGERDRAARLGEEARDTFAAAGPPARRELAEALDWQRRAGVRR